MFKETKSADSVLLTLFVSSAKICKIVLKMSEIYLDWLQSPVTKCLIIN